MRGPEFLIAIYTPLVLKNSLVEKIRQYFLFTTEWPLTSNNLLKDLPVKLKKILPSTTNREFLEWLVGFTDAEGCFRVVPNRNWASVCLNFQIEVHIDDVEVLYKIRKALGIGNVHLGKTRPAASFKVSKLEDIASVIIPIFNEFPLQTTKYLDFISFKDAALILLTKKKGRREGAVAPSLPSPPSLRLERVALSKEILVLKKIKESMNSGRLVIDSKQENILKQKVLINKWWLLGFVEGEGTFGYKHLVPYFQIAQNKKNLFILEAIENYMINIFKLSSSQEIFKYSLNKATGVYSMVVQKVDINFYYILPFFESLTFFSRKNIDYLYWVIVILIHKLGFYYLAEGKKMALDISSATNKYRYTTNSLKKIELPNIEFILKLFSQTPPLDISSGRNHFELVRELTITKGGRKGFTVHIYEEISPNKYKELKGSPFSTYGDGHEAICQIRGSRVIGRYIDTGKKYKDKYLFSSIPGPSQ